MPLRFQTPDGYVRTAWIQLPPDWYLHAPLPVYFVLHGGWRGGPWAVVSALQLQRHAQRLEEPRFVTIVPEALSPRDSDGAGGTFNAGIHSKGWDVDDVGMVAAILDLLQDRLSDALRTRYGVAGPALDVDQICAVGTSAGAYFGYRLAAELAPRYGLRCLCAISGSIAGRSDAGSPWVDHRPQVYAVPPPFCSVLTIHGLHDPDVPYHGGPNHTSQNELRRRRNLTPEELHLVAGYSADAAMGPTSWGWFNELGELVPQPDPQSDPRFAGLRNADGPNVRNVALAGTDDRAVCFVTQDMGHGPWHPSHGDIAVAFFRDPASFGQVVWPVPPL